MGNNLSSCRSCGKAVSRRAEICPSCGDKHPNGSGCGCFVVIALLFIVVLVMIAKGLSGN